MQIKENIKMALSSIRANKMRSFLTMLGIIIGISSVIMIMAIAGGGKNLMMSKFENLGVSTVLVSVDSKNATGDVSITDADIAAVKDKIDSVKYASPGEVRVGAMQAGNEKIDVMLTCGNEDVAAVCGYEIIKGRGFTAAEYNSQAKMALIDENTAKRVFGSTDVVNESIDIYIRQQRVSFRVIGVYRSQFSEFVTEDMHAMAVIPSSVYFNTIGRPAEYTEIYLTSNDKSETVSMGNKAVSLLNNRHGGLRQNAFTAQNMLKQMDQINGIINIFTAIMAAVAAISLVVGGIGVMNIMLVSVTERTREIGIRKSLGAKTKDIIWQFLTESAIITAVGGLAGAIIGTLFSYLIGMILNFTPSIHVFSYLLSILFAALIGLFFGIYPAKKAARLHPIDALREV